MAATESAIRRDEQAGLRIVDAVAKRFGREAAEHDRVHGSDPRAREHGNGKFRNQRQVDRDAIAASDAERQKHVGKLTDLAMQIEIRQRPVIAGFSFPDDRGLVAPCRAHMPIQTVDAGIDLPADKPFRVRRIPLEHA
jgi:hypothetical protein